MSRPNLLPEKTRFASSLAAVLALGGLVACSAPSDQGLPVPEFGDDDLPVFPNQPGDTGNPSDDSGSDNANDGTQSDFNDSSDNNAGGTPSEQNNPAAIDDGFDNQPADNTGNQNAGNQQNPADDGQGQDNGQQNPVDDGQDNGQQNPPDQGQTDPDPPVQPPVGDDIDLAEIENYFASLPCGAKYTAMGDGGWAFCLRLSDGGAACTTNGNAAFQRLTFEGGGALTNVAQVSGLRSGDVGVVTTDGALHLGSLNGVSTQPTIASGVVNFSGGFNATAVLEKQGGTFSVRSWTGNGAPAAVNLPTEPVQVSVNYGIACALDIQGSAHCWTAGGNHNVPGVTETPSQVDLGAPVRLISVGQNSVCGVTFDDRLVCQAAWYDNPWIPSEGQAPDFQVRQATFPSVLEVHAGFAQGVVIDGNGSAFFLGRGGAGQDNPGTQFAGVTNAIAAGGDRGSACVQTQGGSVFCQSGGTTSQATLNGGALTAQAATCPF